MFKTKQITFIAALFLITSFGLIGCGGTQTTTTDNKSANSTTKPADNTTKAADNTAKPADNTAKPADTKTETASADKIGVAECDQYIEKYEACLFSKVPEAQRAMYKPTLDQMKKSWKDAAANPQTKAALATGCKTALDTAKTSMSSFGCKWE